MIQSVAQSLCNTAELLVTIIIPKNVSAALKPKAKAWTFNAKAKNLEIWHRDQGLASLLNCTKYCRH